MFRWHETHHFWHGPIWPGSEIGLLAVGMWIAVAVVAVVITYFIVKIMNTLMRKKAAAPKPPDPTPSEKLLTEIRDLLKSRA